MCKVAALRALGGVAHVDAHLVLQTIHKATDFPIKQTYNGTLPPNQFTVGIMPPSTRRLVPVM